MTRRRILVPIDFQRQSDLALEYAGHMATKLNAMISCIYVIEEQGLPFNNTAGEQTKHRIRREAENRLSERVNSILKHEENIPFEIIITSGKVYQKVLEKSIDLNAQMIVMGKSKSTREGSSRIGSNARRIFAGSTVPVIAVSNSRIEKLKHLILPLDLENRYSDQLIWAIETALLLSASVSLIAVLERELPGLRPVYLKKLTESKRLFSDNNIECNTHLLENQTTVVREILTFSEGIESGIILLMHPQKKKASSPFLGSTASEVLARAQVPVFLSNSMNKLRFTMDSSSQSVQPIYPSRIPMKDHFI